MVQAPAGRLWQGPHGHSAATETGKREYKLVPGDAHLYNEGDLHSPRREAPTRLIRIEGKNMEKVQRFPYERVA